MPHLSTIPLMPLTLFRVAGNWRQRLRRTARRSVTGDLPAAFADPLARAAHIYELAAISGLLILMLTRSF